MKFFKVKKYADMSDLELEKEKLQAKLMLNRIRTELAIRELARRIDFNAFSKQPRVDYGANEGGVIESENILDGFDLGNQI